MPTRLERIMAMDDEIRKGRYPNVQRFCEMFEVKKRTVLEDIKMMKESMGLEIEYDHFNRGYYNANPKKELPSFQLTEGEVFALTLGKEMLAQYTGTSFEPILKSAIEKIKERLPNQIDVNLDDVRNVVRFNAGPVIPISRRLFLDLNHACEHKEPYMIEYYSASRDATSERTVSPYRLLEYRSTWYLIAFCHLRQEIRLFALHRIREYKIDSGAVYVATAPEKIDHWLDAAFQLEHGNEDFLVRIKFNQHAARYIRERRWHHSQELEELPNGECILSFASQSLDETKRWVLAYGKDAEVLEPEILRRRLQDEVQQLFEQYRNQPISFGSEHKNGAR